MSDIEKEILSMSKKMDKIFRSKFLSMPIKSKAYNILYELTTLNQMISDDYQMIKEDNMGSK